LQMEKDDKGSTMIRMGVSGWMFLLVPAYPGCPGSKAVKRSLDLAYLVFGFTFTGALLVSSSLFTVAGNTTSQKRPE